MIDAFRDKISDRLNGKHSDHVSTIILYDVENIINEISVSSQELLTFAIEKGLKAGYGTVAISKTSLHRQIDSVSKTVRTFKQAVIGVRMNDQMVVNVINKPLRENMLDKQIHYFVVDGFVNKMKVLME